MSEIGIDGTPYVYEESRMRDFEALAGRVREMRASGKLSSEVLHRIREHFRIKNIYHSNAIEGNVLAVGETREVVERGLTITGKPLKDQAEARNLSHALDFLEKLAGDAGTPITANDVRQLHDFVLRGISDEAGAYRSVDVRISGSEYSPPGPESVPGEMQELGLWLSKASVPAENAFAGVHGLLAAAAAHTWFVTIHPFVDGNGRVARLLMNLMLMRYGYPIAIITKEDRLRYYDALEESQASDLTPFVILVSECMEESLEEYEAAAKEQREQTEWATSLAETLAHPERVRARNEYEVWRAAMNLLKSQLQHIVQVVRKSSQGFAKVFSTDFGHLEFEKYSTLRRGESAKRTWFLRVDFRSGKKTARYLFFFGHASPAMRRRCDAVTLHLAREEPRNSFNYVRLEQIQSENVPNLAEIGYEMPKERFVVRPRNGRPSTKSVEEFTRQFFHDVIKVDLSVR